jgi:hypothetical protein
VGLFGPVVGDPQTLSIGGYLLCGWITDPNDPTVVFASASAAFTVAASDSLALAPLTGAVEGRPFDVDATGVAYDPDAIIDATYKPAASACAPSPDLDTGVVANVSGNSPDPGAYSDPGSPSRFSTPAAIWSARGWSISRIRRIRSRRRPRRSACGGSRRRYSFGRPVGSTAGRRSR